MIGGLDIGTSNCKLSIYDGATLLVQASASYLACRSEGRHTLDADAVWDAVKGLFHEAFAREPRAANVRALAISALGEAVIPVDGDGKTIGDAILFWDSRGKDELAEIVGKLGMDAIQDISGVVPDPMYTVCKIAWHRQNNPRYHEIAHFLLFEDFIIYRLTGERLISYSLACRTMAFDIRGRAWSDVLFDAVDVDKRLMSTPAASGTLAGPVMPAVRGELGLKGETLVTTGGHDQMCVAVGAGAIREGIASNGSGTVEVMALTLPENLAAGALLSENYTVSIHADPARRFTYSCNSTGSLLLNWYVNAFGNADANESFVQFEANAPQAPTSLVVLPYITGSGTPFMDLGVTGGIAGVTYSTTKYSIYRALMEGLTFDLAYNLERIVAAGAPVKELRTTGGGSLSRMWMQIKADVTGLPVHSLQCHQAGSLGCMILAAVAAGIYANIYEAVDDVVRTHEVFEPNAANHSFYREQQKRFIALFSSARNIVRQ